MPVTIVVGGQFGSEGKGKVSLYVARSDPKVTTIIRVGGTNSGHTGYDSNGKRWQLRQMPAGCIDRNVDVVFPDGSYIDPDILNREIGELRYPRERVHVSPRASVILPEHRRWEATADLMPNIGSTGSGTGGAVLATVARGAKNFPLRSVQCEDCEPLSDLVRDPAPMLNRRLERKERVVIEGTQGFGLSLQEGGFWPKATSRCTTAAGALAEAGLAPGHVDDVILVIRTFPIRVAGDSGPLVGEISWKDVAEYGNSNADLREFTTVTRNLRRVGRFDPDLVRRAIVFNAPNRIVLNHVDYLGDKDVECLKVWQRFKEIERSIEKRIDLIGLTPFDLKKSPDLCDQLV